MNDCAEPDNLRLPRLSRTRTRVRETQPRWSELLAQIAFVALIVLVMAGPWMTNQSEAVRRYREIGYSAVLVVALIAIRPWRRPERLLVVPWPLLLALGYCALSLVWAVAPAVGLRRLILTAIVLWSLFALVRDVGLERAITLLRVLFTLLLVANFVAALALPTLGIHAANELDLAGDWRGVMAQKNYAGLTCAVTILLFAFDAARVPLAVRVGVSAFAALFLVLSDSATSIGILVAALAAGALFTWAAPRFGQRRIAARAWGWLPLGVVAAICFAMALSPQPFLDMVSNPGALTGRTQIWQALIRAYVDRPLTGVGFGSMFDLGPASPFNAYAKDWVATVSQGHNGYLDLLTQIGAPGLLVVLFAAIVWPIQRILRGGDHPTRALGAALLIFCLGHNGTETSLFDRDALGQVVLIFAIALLWGTSAVAIPAQSQWPPRRRRSTK